MKNYEVWIRAREPKSLAVVASVRVFNHADRLEAERTMETAQGRLQLLVLQLLHVHPGALISTEMVMPGMAADELVTAKNKAALLSAALAQAEQREEKMIGAAKAALAYNSAIRACANSPKKMNSFCTAQGDTLDTLYADWLMKSRAVLEAAGVVL